MRINLYNFSKRNKSSARPGEGREVDVQLKDECTIEFPEFIFKFEPLDHNYIYVPKWRRYYFKTEDKYYHGRFFCKYAEDYLATWRDEIRSTSAYVLYDVTEYDIVDTRLPALATPSTRTNRTPMRSDFGGVPLADGGTYVVTVTGSNGLASYIVSGSSLPRLMTNYENWSKTFEAGAGDDEGVLPIKALGRFIKQILGTGSVSSNIRGCVFLPMKISGGVSEEIHLGLYDTNLVAQRIGVNPLYHDQASISIPWQANDWRKNTPYTQLYLYIPFVGMVSYSTSDLLDKSSLLVESTVNAATGEMAVVVRAGTQVLGTYGAQIGASIPVGSSGVSVNNATTSIVKGIAGVVAGGGSVASLASAGASIMGGMEGVSSTVGGMGGGTGSKFSLDLECTTVYHSTLVDPSSVRHVIGCPSMFVKSLNNYSGFVQTSGFQVSCSGTSVERDAVNSLLDSGVYLE